MPRKTKSTPKTPMARRGLLSNRLDVSSPTTAIAFRAAAKAHTEKATRTRSTAVETLRREGILTKSGKFTKAYS